VVKHAALQAGINPKDYAGHSLRAGLVTAAARAGKSIPSIMRQTGHRSVATVTKYVVPVRPSAC
jgi:integrase